MIGKILLRWSVVGIAALLACGAQEAEGKQIRLDAAMGTPVMLAGQKQTAFLRVAMTGFQLEGSERAPVNVALVLDRSGSMTGQKIEQAKDAAIAALDRLNSDDIVSVVAYDDTVQILVSATKLSARESIYQAIRSLYPGNSTALFAGVSRGASEVRKFLDRERVNRIILLSDGLANVGPSSPGDLAELGTSLAREGISVTTIGLGLDYNDDLMTELAMKSDGNHMFAEQATDLKTVFAREFGDVLSVVAKDVKVRIQCPEGIRPVRSIGREADIAGQTVSLDLNQLYGGQMKYLVVEVEVPAGAVGQERNVASVDVSYTNLETGLTDNLRRSLGVAFTDSQQVVDARQDNDVMAAAAYQVAVERNILAMQLRDAGKIEEGRQLLFSNVSDLYGAAKRYRSRELEEYGKLNGASIITWDDDGSWGRTRKQMRGQQSAVIGNTSVDVYDADGNLIPRQK